MLPRIHGVSETTPPTRDARVSAANWLEAPYNRWSMWHVREVCPTQVISRGTGPVLELPDRADPLDLDGVALQRVDGSQELSAGGWRKRSPTLLRCSRVRARRRVIRRGRRSGHGPCRPVRDQSLAAASPGSCSIAACSTRTRPSRRRPRAVLIRVARVAVRHLLDMRSAPAPSRTTPDPSAGTRRWRSGSGGARVLRLPARCSALSVCMGRRLPQLLHETGRPGAGRVREPWLS